jgi:hypothetical protein
VKERAVSRKDAIQLAEKNSMVYFETSAKANTNIAEMFRTLCFRVVMLDYPNGTPAAIQKKSTCLLQ